MHNNILPCRTVEAVRHPYLQVLSCDPLRFHVYTEHRLVQISHFARLLDERGFALRVAVAILPFRTNQHIVDQLIDWDRVPANPTFQRAFPPQSENGGCSMSGMKTRGRKQRSPVTSSMPRGRKNNNSSNGSPLPEQIITLMGDSHAHWTGARRLMLGVFQDALASWFRYQGAKGTRERRLFQETRDWFWSHDRSWLYAFENICEYLDLAPDYIRDQLSDSRSTHACQQRPVVRRQSSYAATRERLAA